MQGCASRWAQGSALGLDLSILPWFFGMKYEKIPLMQLAKDPA